MSQPKYGKGSKPRTIPDDHFRKEWERIFKADYKAAARIVDEVRRRQLIDDIKTDLNNLPDGSKWE